MLKITPKFFIKTLLFIFIFQIMSLVVFLGLPNESHAQIDFKPQITVGDFKSGEAKPITPTSIGQYINAIYKYAIGVVGILAAIVLMYGGILWITALGNAERVSNAQSWIKASLTGLVLALSSYMILYIVNPDLVNFKPLEIEAVGAVGCCDKTETTTKTNCKGTFIATACTTIKTCTEDSSGTCKNSCLTGEIAFNNYSCPSTNETCCVPQDSQCGEISNENTVCRNSCLTGYGETTYLANCGPSKVCCKQEAKECGAGNQGKCFSCGSIAGITSCTATYCPSEYTRLSGGTSCQANNICCFLN